MIKPLLPFILFFAVGLSTGMILLYEKTVSILFIYNREDRWGPYLEKDELEVPTRENIKKELSFYSKELILLHKYSFNSPWPYSSGTYDRMEGIIHSRIENLKSWTYNAERYNFSPPLENILDSDMEASGKYSRLSGLLEKIPSIYDAGKFLVKNMEPDSISKAGNYQKDFYYFLKNEFETEVQELSMTNEQRLKLAILSGQAALASKDFYAFLQSKQKNRLLMGN